jgi:hypothetical protein
MEFIEMESSIQNQPAKRKRGRPPGTKNRPKARAADGYRLAAAKPVDVDFEVRSINAVVENLDKAEGKVDQYYRTISQHIAAIKRAKPDDGKRSSRLNASWGARARLNYWPLPTVAKRWRRFAPATRNGRSGVGKKRTEP